MNQSIVRLIPPALRPPLRKLYTDVNTEMSKLYHYSEYYVGTRMGWRDPLLPPNWLHSVSGRPFDLEDFKAVGEEFFQYFVTIGGLQPDHRVLDVGCGTGRMARLLTKYLKSGSYEGIDIVAPSIRWCQATYTPRYPNFHFQFSDIYNKTYNSAGKYRAFEYRFPFESSSFDFVFLTSVFTHMLPQDLENYFSEVVRVLKQDGRSLITYILLNTESLELIDAKVSPYAFEHRLPGCRVGNADVPEDHVAYDENRIRSLYKKYDLNLLEPIHFGRWCGRKNGLSVQDLIIGTKSR